MHAPANFAGAGLLLVHLKIKKHSLARGLKEHANYPDFCKNHQFHVIYCVTLAYALYFEEFLIQNSH